LTKRIPFDAIVLDQSNMSLRHLAEAVTSICGTLYDATYQNEILHGCFTQHVRKNGAFDASIV
jgi:hypothetical protein